MIAHRGLQASNKSALVYLQRCGTHLFVSARSVSKCVVGILKDSFAILDFCLMSAFPMECIYIYIYMYIYDFLCNCLHDLECGAHERKGHACLMHDCDELAVTQGALLRL